MLMVFLRNAPTSRASVRWSGRCDYELLSAELVQALLVLSEEGANERAFNVIGEAPPRFLYAGSARDREDGNETDERAQIHGELSITDAAAP